jgi:G3E family GTPase
VIPLGLITGFLGSGKTTLLQRIIDGHRDRPIVCIVNECGSIDIDGERLNLPRDQLVTLPGGSIFCKCLSGEFVRVLGELPRHAPANVAGVVIEASGIANPGAISGLLAETRLDRVYSLRSIISVVDPGSFLKLLHTLPNITAQVTACDLAVVNKCDLRPDDQVRRTEDEIRRINPLAAVVRTQFCQVDIDPFAETPVRELHGELAACADPNYEMRSVYLHQPVDAEVFKRSLRELAPGLYRAKGFVPTAAGMLDVDVSASGVTIRPRTGPPAPGRLILIARPEAHDHLARLIESL